MRAISQAERKDTAKSGQMVTGLSPRSNNYLPCQALDQAARCEHRIAFGNGLCCI
jgi:hypothetical protein